MNRAEAKGPDYAAGYHDGVSVTQDNGLYALVAGVCLTVLLVFGIMATCYVSSTKAYNSCQRAVEYDSLKVKTRCKDGLSL